MGRVRRVLLFMPGDSRKKILKAAGLGVDSVILDLEDGVAHGQKAAARATVRDALKTVQFGQTERLVRINPVGSGLEVEDIAGTLEGEPDGYVIPKVEETAQIQWVSREIRNRWKALGKPGSGHLPLLVLIETARAVMYLREIAAADPQIVALVFGAEDLVGSLGAIRTREGMEVFYARSAVAIAAAAHGLQAIDTIYTQLNDLEGLARDARFAATLGYEGKLAIHPNQIGPIAEAFTPSADAIEAALRLVQAYEAHAAAGQGAFVHDGKMVDMPMIRAARSVLAKARAAGKIMDKGIIP